VIQSDSDFCVVGLEVEFLSGRGEGTRDFLVEVVDVIFEVALSLIGGEVEGEGLLVADHSALALVEPLAVVLVHKVPRSHTQYLFQASLRSTPKFWINSRGLILGTTDLLASGVISE